MIPLNLDLQSASALYILIDNAVNSLSAEQDVIAALKLDPTKTNLTMDELNELGESIDSVIESGKQLSLDVGAIIDELDDDEDFKPFVG